MCGSVTDGVPWNKTQESRDRRKSECEIAEISYTYLETAIYKCGGYFDLELKWHEGNYWPQYFQIIDALGVPDLKQPEL